MEKLRLQRTPRPPDSSTTSRRRTSLAVSRSARAASAAILTILALTVCDAANGADDALAPAADRKVDFRGDVQPIFRRTCITCHGPEKQESGLRLDKKATALAGGDSGRDIVPGNSGESRLLMLVAGLDDDLGIMPPDGEGTPLTRDQVGILRAWIEQGAIWPDDADATAAFSHWSFQPIRDPAVPSVADNQWTRSPIDAFVLSRLEKQEIHPSPSAERTTLARRLHLDLLGLPPSPDELHAFLADDRPDAVERLVDRLLASPHFGERWARHWLDLARYADSDGYEKDNARPFAWRYRQWVIEAINADMPYDRFSIEQIAGDLLADAGDSQRVATGFHRNTLHNTEGGIDPEEDRVKKTIDRTNTLGTIWLGLTVGCAQCHSHKYDPLPQREYYSFYALMNSIDETNIDAPLPEQRRAYDEAMARFEREHSELQSAVTKYEASGLADAQAKWEAEVAASPPVWTTLEPETAVSAKGATIEKQDDGSLLATGANEHSDVYTIRAVVPAGRITALRLEVLPDKSLVAGGPGRANNGNFVLTTLSATVSPIDGSVESTKLAFAAARADFSQGDWDVGKAINDNPQDGWAVSPQFGKRHVAVFEFKEPVAVDGAARLTVTLDQTYNGPNPHNIGRFRLSVTSARPPVSLEGLTPELAMILATPREKRSDKEQTQLDAYYCTIDPELARLTDALKQHAGRQPKLPDDAKAQAVSEKSPARETHVLVRGDFLNPGDVVAPGTFSVFPPLAARGDAADRLDLAYWLFASDNPLTARVAANRVWQRLFGRGIVVTGDDFGTQGQPPTHPALLDWLAVRLREDCWSRKRLIGRIVTSAAYRQSSAARLDLVDVDPENALLARSPRRRVDAELIRDLALATSGLLDPRLGGPSVRPPQSAEYSDLTYAGSARWEVSKGGDRYRRGVYTFFQRTSPYPMLMTFDSPDSTECTTQRARSNTPLQALTLWNDPVFFEAAQSLARRVVREIPADSAGTDAAVTDTSDTDIADSDALVNRRIAHAFELCLSRQPTDGELDTLRALYRDQLALAQADEKATASIAGEAPMPPDTTTAELAAWVAVSRTLMNLDEFISRP